MRTHFDEQMALLNKRLLEMGALIEQALNQAGQALRENNCQLAKAVASGDRLINEKEKEIEHLCMLLILKEQPVASDLRIISAALKMVTDMERIGDQAADIAEISCGLASLSGDMDLTIINQMLKISCQMVKESIDSYVNQDLVLAAKVRANDDEVDRRFLAMKNHLVEEIENHKGLGEQALDLLMIAKYLERVADHAVNIAEWVTFFAIGPA